LNINLKNPELKWAAAKLLALQIAFSISVFLFCGVQLDRLSRDITGQNTALIGHILYSHPELENEITGFVTKEASGAEIQKGKQVLEQYGYGESMPALSQPVLGNFYNTFRFKASFAAFIYILPLFLLLLMEFERIYRKVGEISAASEGFVEGNFEGELPEDGEGDFAVLNHSFNTMANRLRLSLEKLKDDKVFLKNIISDISHQLKTPLSSLIMFNELMLKDKNMNSDVREDFLLKTKSQLERMEWLIIDLLKMARLEAGAIAFEKRRVPLIRCVEKALVPLIEKANSKNQEIRVTGGEDVYFNGDEDWTAEALTNIVKNCIEHTGRGGRITIGLSGTPLFGRVIIEDNGEGIERSDLPHIFERFYQGGKRVSAENVGIGLALTKLIVESQGGTVTAISEKGKGTRFTVTFLKGVI
jgi:Signal transduction histidine kinase